DLAPHDVVVLAPGTYRERIVIRTPHVTLRAEAAGVRLSPPDVGGAALRVRAVRGVTLQGLTIVGGGAGVGATGDVDGLRLVDLAVAASAGDGVVLTGTGAIALERTTVRGVGGNGVVVRGVRARLHDVRVEGCTRTGVRLLRGEAHLRSVVLHANGDAGLRARRGRVVLREALVAENRGPGIALDEPVAATIADTRLWDNAVDLVPPETTVGAGVRFGAPAREGTAAATRDGGRDLYSPTDGAALSP
ncbi:MAG: right-handed parallel beta-helix repeat-containing protein, partial [Thermodesulfobacteriota bacterium]